MKIRQGDIFLLKFEQDSVYLSKTIFIDKSKVEINSAQIINNGVKWKISVVNYIPNERRIFAEVLNYQSSDDDFSALQNEVMAKNTVDKINFKNINTNELLKSSSPSKKISASPNKVLTKRIINTSFNFPIRLSTFLNGAVAFTKFIKEANQEVKFKIHNPLIKEEYDSVKNYFESYLKSKQIIVKAQIIIKNRKIIDCRATSNEISKINESAIESVKFDFLTRQFLKSGKNQDSNKNLHTIDELYDELTVKRVKASTFHSSPETLMNDIITIKSSKHYKQLRYLSSKHLSKILRLRFVLNPFSFVFLLQNKEAYFIIWETLNTSEATYIWIVKPKATDELKAKLVDIDNIIGKIKDGGKRLYLKENPENFVKINHDYTNKEKGIKMWIKELENILEL